MIHTFSTDKAVSNQDHLSVGSSALLVIASAFICYFILRNYLGTDSLIKFNGGDTMIIETTPDMEESIECFLKECDLSKYDSVLICGITLEKTTTALSDEIRRDHPRGLTVNAIFMEIDFTAKDGFVLNKYIFIKNIRRCKK